MADVVFPSAKGLIRSLDLPEFHKWHILYFRCLLIPKFVHGSPLWQTVEVRKTAQQNTLQAMWPLLPTCCFDIFAMPVLLDVGYANNSDAFHETGIFGHGRRVALLLDSLFEWLQVEEESKISSHVVLRARLVDATSGAPSCRLHLAGVLGVRRVWIGEPDVGWSTNQRKPRQAE